MGIYGLFILAIALSMDSLAVSIANGLCINNLSKSKTLKIAFFLALFQAAFPVFGYFIGHSLEKYLESIDHWIAFALLGFIGVHMIYEAISNKNNESKCYDLSNWELIMQSIGTSIDALIVGVSFAFLNVNLKLAFIIIFITTFIFSILGIQLGKKIGNKYSKFATISGGIILIIIGTKVLLEHLYF